MKNKLLQTWKENTSSNTNNLIVYVTPFLLFFVILIISTYSLSYNIDIIRYASANNLPSLTVLMRLGHIDITFISIIAILTFLVLAYNLLRRYILNTSTKLINITLLGVIFSLVLVASGVFKKDYQQIAGTVQTPIRTYLQGKALDTMKVAQLEMGTIINSQQIGVDTYKVVVKTANDSETFTMNTPVIPADATPIWIAYKSNEQGKTMVAMGVLPVRPF
jgi:hypothetical protein